MVEFGPDGRVRMILGRKQEAGDANGPLQKGPPFKPAELGRFRQPTNVAFEIDEKMGAGRV